jgi:ubiquinone/menaquinone biosynthesis C-methylase UbiE
LAPYGFAPLDTKKILEGGCRTGYWLREFIKWEARPEKIAGTDLLADRIAEASRLCPKGVRLQCGSAAELPFPDQTFDLVLQSTVFSSVLGSSMKQRMASEMLWMLKEDGLIL